MKLVRKYTVQESWENDTLGNALAIYNLLMKDIVEASVGFNTVIAVAENNSASRYNIDLIVATGNQGGISTFGSGVIREHRGVLRGISSSVSTWASVGTIFKIYAAY